MSVLIIDLYSADSWSISTVLCASGVISCNDKIDSSLAILWSCCCWAPGRGDCPVASFKPSDQRLPQRRPNDRKCWAGNVVRSGSVEWLTVNDAAGNVWDWCTVVDQVLRSLVLQTAMHCDSQLVGLLDAFWDVEPVQLLMQHWCPSHCTSFPL